MVATTIDLPNIRKMFLPDPGYIVIDVDLERADAQTVAWEAGDEELKDMFRSGDDVHTLNAMAAFQLTEDAITYELRQRSKQAVHGFNFGGSPKAIAAETGMSLAEATLFQENWFSAHPKIPEWQEKIYNLLKAGKPIRNAFGYENIYFDRVNPKRHHEALSWIPQSTTAIVTNKGLVKIDRELPQVQPLLQVHDSLLLQTLTTEVPEIYEQIQKAMTVTVPYDDPLVIQTGFSASTLSWGHLVELKTVPKLLKAANENKTIKDLAKLFKLDEETVEMVLKEPQLYGKAA